MEILPSFILFQTSFPITSLLLHSMYYSEFCLFYVRSSLLFLPNYVIIPYSYSSPFFVSCSCSYHILTMFLRHPFPTTILLLSLHNYYIILHHTTPYYYIPTIVSYFSLRLIICLLLCLNYSIIFYHFPSFHPSSISPFVFYFICIIFLSFDIMCFVFDITCFTAP